MFVRSSLKRVWGLLLLPVAWNSSHVCAGLSLVACGRAMGGDGQPVAPSGSAGSNTRSASARDLGGNDARFSRLPAPPSAGRWRYRVHYDNGGVLSVAGQFAPTSERSFVLEPALVPFVQHLQYAATSNGEALHWQAVGAVDSRWTLECSTGCQLRYQVRLAEAAREVDEVDAALASGQIVLAPPSSWLVHPDRRAKGEVRLRVSTADGLRFMSAMDCAGAEPGCEYRAPAALLDKASFAAFGPLEERVVVRGGSRVVLGFAKQGMPFDADVGARWLSESLGAVSAYYRERLPAPHALVLMLRGSGGPTRGKTLSAGGPAIVLRAGDEINASSTADDWVLPHELLHVNFPDVGRSHAWLSEGLASYIEPLARARVGLLEPKLMWRELIEGLPQGQPEAGDQGLEHTATWGRVYWGGALFCLVADVMIRERTQNLRSLDDVLLAVSQAGANVETYWPLGRLWQVGDAATGTTVLSELYERMALRAETTDLDALFRRLGVRLDGHVVSFDESAPLAEIRRSLTRPNKYRNSSDVDETNREGERSSP